MRTLRLSPAGTVMVVLLGWSGGAMAQEADAPAVWVTGPETQAPCEVGDVESLIDDGPVTGHRGLSITCADDLGDSRLSGPSVKVYNDDCYEGAGCVCWGTQELTGPDGSWIGTFTGTTGPDGSGGSYQVLTGTGSYDGLTYVGLAVGQFGEPPRVFGRVYEGDPPPSPGSTR
jgi:hypothetical protein